VSLKRYAAKRDQSEKAILQALKQVGADYLLLDAVDVLVLYRGDVFMLECKTPTSKRGTVRKTRSQVDLSARGWPIFYVTTGEQALRAIGAMK
jgi:hypothetical protein